MKWAVEYYEQTDGAQPAEIYEDALKRDHPKLAGKQRRVFVGVLEHGRRLGGGLIEPLHDYPGLWEARTIFDSWLAREFFAWDGDTAILLHGYVKRSGEVGSKPDMARAQTYWLDYQKTYRVSPEEPEEPQKPHMAVSDTAPAAPVAPDKGPIPARKRDDTRGKRQTR